MPELNKNSPLLNKMVLITRASHQFGSLAEKFELLGAETIACPVIEIHPPEDPTKLDRCLQRIGDYAAVLFLSSNAVEGTLARIRQFELPAVRFPSVVAMGNGTLRSLASAKIDVQLTPPESNSQSMAAAVIDLYRKNEFSKPVLILRANRGSDFIPDSLAAAKIPFQEVAAYRSVDTTEVDQSIVGMIALGHVDWITVTSSSIARNVARLFRDSLAVSDTKIATISPTTTAASQESGLVVTAEATRYDLDGLVDAIVKYQASVRE